MKQLIALPLLLASISAVAGPYFNAGYGVGVLSHDKEVVFNDGTHLALDNSDLIFAVGPGYRFDNNFGLEVSYSQFDQDNSKSQYLGVDSLMRREKEWEANMKARQVAIKPAYFFDLSDSFTLKGTLGLTYTEYKTSGVSYIENESILDDDREFNQHVGTIPEQKNSAVGVIVGLAAEYQLYKGLHIGAEAN
ncbi:AcfA family outer membrane beta-barrel protein [Endozoicomonas sp. SCSIO W0465]|uniref:AcfA family outer membrane beta-barrel protein n=1 Tax=Endozoicomonas sp. SCSIO W0465 TaxID=2918516 RepID=UPI00207533A3|nr:AcfA family outer membrane beta-barrel protein [Endozoicomonas sp. SCSIO W0465]USE37390.1 AcfA family outer membrane beta-barrel protein [Endozoicomonas sp. SCSIO W0465]